MKISRQTPQNQQGFTLILTMIFLVVLSLMGITAMRSSRIDVQIAGNERWSTDSFYRSEGGGDMTTRLLEDMSRGKVGGSDTEKENFLYGGILEEGKRRGGILIADLDFDLKSTKNKWKEPSWGTHDNLAADVLLPNENLKEHKKPYAVRNRQLPMTQIIVAKTNKKPVGTSMETGRSSGSSSSGAEATFVIWTRNTGTLNAETVLHTKWLHIDP